MGETATATEGVEGVERLAAAPQGGALSGGDGAVDAAASLDDPGPGKPAGPGARSRESQEEAVMGRLDRIMPKWFVERRALKAAEALRAAVGRGDKAATRELLARGPHRLWPALGLVGREDPRALALLDAAAKGRADLARLLLDAGAAAGPRVEAGWDALATAAKRRDEGVLAELSSWLRDPATGATQARAWAALHAFVANGDRVGASLLVGAGIDPDALSAPGWDGRGGSWHSGFRGFRDGPALVEAVLIGDVEMVRSLLASGANPNKAYVGGVTALMLAALDDYCQRYPASGVGYGWDDWRDPRARRDWRDRKGLIEALAEGGADLDARTERGDTALGLALRHDAPICDLPPSGAAIEPLAAAGAGLDDVSIDHGRPISALNLGARSKSPLALKVLLGQGAQVGDWNRLADYYRAGWGRGPYADDEGVDEDFLRALLGVRCDLNHSDRAGRTAPMIAREKKWWGTELAVNRKC